MGMSLGVTRGGLGDRHVAGRRAGALRGAAPTRPGGWTTARRLVVRLPHGLPLDGLNTIKELRERVQELSPVVGLFKVGKETFTRMGPEAIKAVKKLLGKVKCQMPRLDPMFPH